MDKELLKTISKESIKTIINLDDLEVIITPEVYKKIFSEICESNNIDISKVCDEVDSKSIIEESMLEINNFFNSTKEKFSKLQNITDSAHKAIVNRDNSAIKLLQSQIEELKEELNSLEEKIYIDKLTKTFNKHWLIEKKLGQDLKFSTDGVFALVSIDDYEEINHTYGYETSTKCSIYIVDELKKYYNEIVKFEKNEFILFSDESANHLKNFLNRFKDKLSLKSFYTKGKVFNISFSYGVTEFKKGDFFQYKIDAVDELIQESRKHI